MIPYEQKLKRVLDVMGGLYTLDDILTRVADGRMQSFSVNNSWAITELQVFPRARKINVLAVVGDLQDVPALEGKVLQFADKVNVGLITTYGRRGWVKEAEALGWRAKAKSILFYKEL